MKFFGILHHMKNLLILRNMPTTNLCNLLNFKKYTAFCLFIYLRKNCIIMLATSLQTLQVLSLSDSTRTLQATGYSQMQCYIYNSTHMCANTHVYIHKHTHRHSHMHTHTFKSIQILKQIGTIII